MAQATGQAQPRTALLRFSAPLAPPVAADQEERSIDFEALMADIEEQVEKNQISLIEGAGGVLAPLTWDHTIIDIARHFNAQVIVVAHDKLGCLNHIRLTLSAIRAHELEIAAVILTSTTPDIERDHNSIAHSTTTSLDISPHSNYDTLKRLRDVPSVTKIPYTANLDAAADAVRSLAKMLAE